MQGLLSESHGQNLALTVSYILARQRFEGPFALGVEANRRFRDTWVALQAAGFWRAPVPTNGIEMGDLIECAG